MAITYIPGPEALLAPAARELTEGVMKFLNPNRDFQMGMQKALGANPELIQQLADLEATSPGTMKRLGMGALGDTIAAVQETPESQVRREGRGAAVEAGVLDLENEALKNENLNKILMQASEEIAKNSGLTTEAAYKMILGQTRAQTTIETEEARVAPGAADVAITQNERTLDNLKTSVVNLPDLGAVDMREEARKFLDGDLDGATASAYFTNPSARDAFITSIENLGNERQIAANRTIAGMRSDTRGELTGNFKVQKAFQEYQRSGGVGTLDMWERFLFDPTTQKRAAELLADPSKAKPEERELLRIAQVNEQQVGIDKLTNITTIAGAITKQAGVAGNAPKPERESAIASLNILLGQRAQLGGPKLTARYNDRGFAMPGRIEYVDEDGKVYTGEEVERIVTDPFNNVPTLTELDMKFVDRIQAHIAGPQQGFELYKGQEMDEARRQRVEAYLREQGVIR